MTDMPPTQKHIYCRAIARLMLADIVLNDAESDFLYKLMTRMGLDEESQTAVINQVNLDDPIEDSLQNLDEDYHSMLLAELRQAALIDGNFAKREGDIIEKVRKMFQGET